MQLSAFLNTIFHVQKIRNQEKFTHKALEFAEHHPFDFYFLNFSWDYYARDFLEKYGTEPPQSQSETHTLALSCFVTNAARISFLVSSPPQGKHWDAVLKQAETHTDPFVQLSLTFYKLCNYQDQEKNSQRLTEQLAAFKRDYPDYYRIIGFVD